MSNFIKSTKVMCESSTFLTWQPDVGLINNTFPKLCSVEECDLFDAVERECQEDVFLYAKNYPVLEIILENGVTHIIHYKDIVDWYPSYVDSYRVLAERNYLFLILSPADGQAGAIGIWNANSLKWSFNYYDEFFCVESVSVISEIDTVIGNTYFHLPMQPVSGKDLFVIRNGQINLFKSLEFKSEPKLVSEYLYRLQGINETTVYRYFNDWLVVIMGEGFRSYFLVPAETRLFE